MEPVVQAVKDIIICEEIADAQKTEGGLFIPETAAKQLPQKQGKVVSFGMKVESEIEVGDIVVYHTNGGQAMVLNGKIYTVLKDGEVYGIVKRPKNGE